VDGDGRTDVVVSVMLAPDGEGPGGVAFYRNTGGQLTSVPVWESEERFHSFSLALGDVDLDGDLDLAVAVGEPFFHDPGQNLLFLREGGAFAEPSAWRSEPVRHSMDVAFLDADGNGALDLAFANDLEAHTLYLNTGDGTAPGLPSTTPSWEATHGPFEGNSLDHGDVDGDGHTDLVFSDSNYWLGGRGTLSLYCGPAFTHCWESADPAGYQSAVALVDLDGDDDLDLAAGKWWDRVRFYRNEGGLETLPSDETAHQAVVEAFAFHDTDGAALDDLVFEAEGPLVPLPRPCHPRASDPPGTWTDGWLVVPGGGTVQVTCGVSPALDLLVTDWDEDEGSALYIHR